MTSLSDLRQLALAYLDLATDADRGRSETDPLYIAITEERDFGKGYSSCGDLAHWLLFRLGVRCSWVNRAESATGWKMGANIWRLVSCPASRGPIEGEHYEPGDILVIYNDPQGKDAHALVVREHRGHELLTADYGQPGGARRNRPFVRGLIGSRKLQRVLPLGDALRLAEQSGGLVPPQSLEAYLRSIGPGPGGRPVLRRGHRSPYVRELQQLLQAQVSGDFDAATETAVKRRQKLAAMPTTGIVDAATWTMLLDRVPW